MAYPVAYPSAPSWFKVEPGTVIYNDEVPDDEFYVKGYICTGDRLTSSGSGHSTFFCPHTPEFHGLVWPVQVDEDYVVPSLSDYTMSSVSYGYISANNLALGEQV